MVLRLRPANTDKQKINRSLSVVEVTYKVTNG